MKNAMDRIWLMWTLIVISGVKATSTDKENQSAEKTDRSGRSWHHHALFGSQQMLMQHQQSLPSASTIQPGDTSNQQSPQNHQQPTSDGSATNRNFEDHDKNVPSASEQDFMSRHYGYLNVHRFDPNFPYYDRHIIPRFPSNHIPRFGPGYRKDKYGHGYGYSCKQGDDCDEVRAANQLNAIHPPPDLHAHLHNSMVNPLNGFYPEHAPFPSSFPNVMSSYGPYGGAHFGSQPARFNDPHLPPYLPPSMMTPGRPYYQARYLHDQEDYQAKDNHEQYQEPVSNQEKNGQIKADSPANKK